MALTGIVYFMYKQIDSDLQYSVTNISSNFIPTHTHELSGSIIRITDRQGNILINTAQDIPDNSTIDKLLQNSKWEIKTLNSLTAPTKILKTKKGCFAFVEQKLDTPTETYSLMVFTPLTEYENFLETAYNSLLLSCVAGMIFSLLSGLLLSHKILKPLRGIIKSFQNIQINNLNQQIALPNSKDELYQLADTCNHMLERLENGLEQQRRFTSDASHELRTPITIISGYVDMLERWGKNDSAVLCESLAAIQAETKHMKILIEKLLCLAKMDSGKTTLNKSQCNIDELLTELVYETHVLTTEHTIKSELQASINTDIDIALLKQMLRTFIENSIKYTPAGGKITIKSFIKNKHLHISVQDTGIGIAQEDCQHIFERFYRAEKSRSKESGGTGLGLAIAQWIAQLHNGKIDIESTPQVGTSITFIMPV